MMKLAFFIVLLLTISAQAQTFVNKEFAVSERPNLYIENKFGRVRVVADEAQIRKVSLVAESPQDINEQQFTFTNTNSNVQISVNETKNRVDVTLRVPNRSKVQIVGADGEISVAGNLESVDASTNTGTIYADVPLDAVKYDFLWTASKPRFLSEIDLYKVKERSGGKFSTGGKIIDSEISKRGDKKKAKPETAETAETAETGETSETKENETLESESAEPKTKNQKPKTKTQFISLNFTTERGIILLNVPPSRVPNDLTPRKLTVAAKTIVRSGDSILSEAIRKVNPKDFGDYAKTLSRREREPILQINEKQTKNATFDNSGLRRVNVSVSDVNSRAVNGLQANDFAVTENNETLEIVNIEKSSEPFNLVLLLDVSGSVESRIDFIRKSARDFINATSPNDKLAIVTFRDDVQVLTKFTTDKRLLSSSLDTFDAGDGTALYDALAFSLVETLRPLRGERTAVVILSDGDDNKSFLPFDSITGAIEESGALIYPLYIPSSLIPANAVNNADTTSDSVRTRYLSVTTKAESEGKRLAAISGGTYFPIRRLDDLQKAYEDVVSQLRTSYTITYRSTQTNQTGKSKVSPRIKVNRENVFVRTSPTTNAPVLKSEVENKVDYFDNFDEKLSNAIFQKASFTTPNAQDSNVTGDVKAIKYKSFAAETLREIPLENLDVNVAPPSFVLANNQNKIAVSRWVSPKRTRSYPYQRMYDTLGFTKRAAVIPLVKDEGAGGDRDFLQFDTFSLLNLLEVYVVSGYYDAAKISPRRDNAIIDQQLNNDFVTAKLKELTTTTLSPYEWNLRELKNLKVTVEAAKTAYQKLAEQMKIRLHDAQGLDNFVNKLSGDIAQFAEFSRQKSQRAQNREINTDQPKETMPTQTKSRITISDYLGGKYFFTVDEAVFENETLYLIESKHHQGGKLTSIGDIKEGLVKMMVYRNLVDVKRNGKPVKHKAVLRLTANKTIGAITSDAKPEEIAKFIEANNFNAKQAKLLRDLMQEATFNNFVVRVEQADTTKK
ncbi:MAG: VWA domain-containing protein [Pyrinomonadaceae bacterium]|nr:VWA domain-containing protein [Pyrinomonadaceae bacterium]